MLDLFHLVLQIAVILVAARLVGFLFQKINQPQVMGEMVAGILLGPSLLGWLAPGVSKALFPLASLSYLNALSQVGLVVFMFVVGLALNPNELHGYGHAAVLTSHVSIVAPFCLGGLTALYLYPRLSDDGVTFTGFALFMGAAMSITAFPVLARILSERGLVRSRMGTLAIACAAVTPSSRRTCAIRCRTSTDAFRPRSSSASCARTSAASVSVTRTVSAATRTCKGA